MSRDRITMTNDETSSSSGFSLISRNEAESKCGLTDPLSNLNFKPVAQKPARFPASAKSTTSSEASSFLLVKSGKRRKGDTSGSGSWFKVDDVGSSGSLANKKQKTDTSTTTSDVNSKNIACPRCTFKNSILRQVCGMCDAALTCNPSLNDDEQLARYLQLQEAGGENYVPREENVYPPARPGQSQALLQQCRILANDILAAIQLCQEESKTATPNKKRTPLVHVSPIPQDHLTSMLSRFLEYQSGESSTSKGKVHLCYCITHIYEAPMIQQRGFGENMRFSATPEGAVASFEFDDIPKYTHIHERQQQQRNTPTYGRERARHRESLDDIVRWVKEQDVALQVESLGNILEPNTTAWLVAVPASSSSRGANNKDFRAAVNRNGNIRPAMVYYRDQALPLVSFPAEMIYQDSIGKQLYHSLQKVCQESLAGCFQAAATTKAAMLPAGTPSPGWSSIKRKDRAFFLPKFR